MQSDRGNCAPVGRLSSVLQGIPVWDWRWSRLCVAISRFLSCRTKSRTKKENHFVRSALNRDYNLVLGTIILYSSVLVFLNLLVDILYTFLDPRVSYD